MNKDGVQYTKASPKAAPSRESFYFNVENYHWSLGQNSSQEADDFTGQ